MIRTCDGTDPTLVMLVEQNDGWDGMHVMGRPVPCNCGQTFDDVDHSTIFPHAYIPSVEERRKLIDAYLESPEGADLKAVLAALDL